MEYPVNKTLSYGPYAGLSYRDTGEGFPVVLIHGFPLDGSIWNAYIEGLENNYRLLVPDLPGSGGSPLTPALSIESMAEAVHAMLSHEKIDSCIVIGHSMGGYITLALAEQFPHLLKGWGLFHATALADSEEKKQARLRSIALMHQYGAHAFLRQMIPGMFSAGSRDLRKEEIDALVNHATSLTVAPLEAYYRAMMQRPDRTRVLKDSRVPVLFIAGKEDTAAPLNDLLQQVQLPSIAAIYLFAGVAHMGMLEVPAKITIPVIRNFVELCRHMTV